MCLVGAVLEADPIGFNFTCFDFNSPSDIKLALPFSIFSFLSESIPSCHLGDLIPAGSRVSESHNASIVSSRSSTLISEISAIVIYISSVKPEYILTEAIKKKYLSNSRQEHVNLFFRIIGINQI